MAAFQKRGKNWRAIIRRKGFEPVSGTFDSKADAVAWAGNVEKEMRDGRYADRSEVERTTLSEAFDRYGREVSSTKKGKAQELVRIEQWKRHAMASRSLASIRSADIATYRDHRLKSVGPNTVRLELALISHLFSIAAKEWGLPVENPVRNIRRPRAPQGRDRRLVNDEEQRLLKACGASRSPWLGPLVRLAIETAMRMGEMLNLTWSNVDLARGTAHLPETKSGDRRTVPLSEAAKAVLKQLPRSVDGRVFPIGQMAVERSFQNARTRAKIEEIRFHDLRHEATSRMFEKGLNTVEVATITGHKTLQMLKRYTHLRAEDLVSRLG